MPLLMPISSASRDRTCAANWPSASTLISIARFAKSVYSYVVQIRYFLRPNSEIILFIPRIALELVDHFGEILLVNIFIYMLLCFK